MTIKIGESFKGYWMPNGRSNTMHLWNSIVGNFGMLKYFIPKPAGFIESKQTISMVKWANNQ